MSTAVKEPARPGKRSRGRRVRRLIVVLVVLLGLLVGADFGAAAFAEHTVSQKAREQLGLSQDPEVAIRGFPFITQALSGEYRHITVSADGVPVSKALDDVSINADLRDVTAPLSDLTSGNVDNIKIGDVEGEVTVKDSDIAHVSPLDNLEDLRIDPSSEDYVLNGEGGSGESSSDSDAGSDSGSDSGGAGTKENLEDSKAGVRIFGKAKVAGEEIEAYCFAMIELEGTTIRITPHRLQFGNDHETTVVPSDVQKALLPSFEAKIDTRELPFTVTPKTVEVSDGEITIKGEAKNVTFAPSATQQ